MPVISIEQLEAAINAWRNRKPSPEGNDQAPALCAEAGALADVYAMMIFQRLKTVDTATFNDVQSAAYAAATPERYA
ncbi:DUF3717 domain-containing protein [Burkholderia multivorans]|uniref:DUF3717 domain-containing protein n=1 Tax=Burkholderia multivorans TaxID=87883 RepID=UPI00158AB790|nr:DUF3717 domain-containing protein [Burkholderia multivorans]MDN8102620.1 DUF3717 domain-containing protein [Burkholderia multivorans]